MRTSLRDERLYWRGSVIWARVLGGSGRIIRRTTKCRDEAAAVAKANEFERIAADPRHAAAEATSFAGGVTALLADMRRRKRATATLKKAEQKLGHFARIWGADMPLLRLHGNPQMVLDYIDRRQRETASDHTIKMELQHLGMLLKMAIHLRTFPGTVAEVLPPFFSAGHKPRSRWLTPEEVTALVRALHRHRAAHIMYIVATGARLAESFRARRSDTDWERRLVHIHGTKTVLSDDDIPVTVVNERALEWALANAPGKDRLFNPWGKLHRDLEAACVRAGIKKCTPNDLRRTFGKWHRLAGVEVDLVAKLLRHSDDKLAQTTYAKVSGGEVGALASKQITSTPALLLPGDPGVSNLYAPTGSDRANGDHLRDDSAGNSSAPETIRTSDQRFRNALDSDASDGDEPPRIIGNRLAWQRRKARVGVRVLYAQVAPKFSGNLLLHRETVRSYRAGFGADEVRS